MDKFHTSVLLKEALDSLNVEEGKKYIDATLGGGGYALEILNRGGEVLAIDADQESIDYVSEKFKAKNSTLKLKIVKGNFKNLEKIAKETGFEKVDGVVFDLGVSSHQIDNAQRGFSFLKDGPLDMRMDQKEGINAEYLVNVLEKDKLYELFKEFGEENNPGRIVRAIVERRKMKAIKTTSDLVSVIASALGIRGLISDFQKNKIAQKVFQALRIAVNSELESLKLALPQGLGLLNTNGILAVVSFHSLEDSIVKRSFKNFEERGLGEIVTQKPVYPLDSEVNSNPRSKSAKLRVFRKN